MSAPHVAVLLVAHKQNRCVKLDGMRLCFLYHPASEHRRMVEEYVYEILRSRGIEIELCSVDERKGADVARVYDVVEYPSLLAIEGNGSLAKLWRGEPLPLMDEVAGYSR